MGEALGSVTELNIENLALLEATLVSREFMRSVWLFLEALVTYLTSFT